MDKNDPDNATIFRSINPTVNGSPIFSFEVEQFDFDIQPGVNFCTITKWLEDPADERMFSKIFEDQMKCKQNQVPFKQQQIYAGNILVAEIDSTVIDGASEVQSLGLIDIYDMPPVDTWFYLTRDKGARLLFAWIPAAYEHTVNEAISVNCFEIFEWFENRYPKDYENLLTK